MTGQLTIMMADVTGSVSLYESLGDAEAHRRIVQCQSMMKHIIESCSGRVIEVVGDEIMSVFEQPDFSVNAASEINNQLYRNNEYSVGVRIGIHAGPTSLENGRPFGDTVNIAARMVACARNSQIILSEQVFHLLSSAQKDGIRFFSQVYVKGKKQPYNLYLVPPEHDESTILFNRKADQSTDERRRQPRGLSLRYQGSEKVFHVGNSDFLLGRGKQCGLIVNSPAASRIHANLSFHGGRILFSDCSSNGSFIITREGRRSSDGKDNFVHHDDWVLSWKGHICLGESVSEAGGNIINYQCLY